MLRKIGKIWHVDISHPSLTKRLRFSTKTSDKTIAQKIHDSAYREILENSISGYKIKNIILNNFKTEFLTYSKINHSPKTTETYKYAFMKLLCVVNPNIPIKDISSFDIENIKKIIPNKTTFNIYYNHLKAAFNYAIKWKYIKINPFDNVKKFKINEKTRRDIHYDEFYQLIDTIQKDSNQLFAEFLIFMFIVGARRQELLNLQWSDIHYEQDYFELKNTKGKKDALIPLNDTLIQILKNRPPANKPFNYLPNFVTKKFKYYCRQTGLSEDIVLHSIRHATTTILFEKHEHPLIIQNLIRHKDLKTTLNYTHTMPSFLKSAINKTTEIVKDFIK